MSDKISKNKKIMRGIVTSDKTDKTLTVSVNSLKTHSKYLKKYRMTKKYKVHDPENKYKTGDTVEFFQCRPISKDKKFTVI